VGGLNSPGGELSPQPLEAAPDAPVEKAVADLALQAAGKVVGETMTGEREKRLVSEFLAETSGPAGSSKS